MGSRSDAQHGYESPSVKIDQYWYAPEPADDGDTAPRVYRLAILVDCSINFRSLKAGINHSEERPYTGWVPNNSLPVDWDVPALEAFESSRLRSQPDPEIAMPEAPVEVAPEYFREVETDLVESLVRRERIVLSHNSRFGLYSGFEEEPANFLNRAAEVALQEIEPELKRLKQVFELRLEQIRETHLSKRGRVVLEAASAEEGKSEIARLLTKRTEFSETEKRIAGLFTGLAGLVMKIPVLRPAPDEETAEATAEFREDLTRMERDAAEALNALFTQYLEMVQTVDDFEIRIQPANIRVLRRAVVWVPTAA